MTQVLMWGARCCLVRYCSPACCVRVPASQYPLTLTLNTVRPLRHRFNVAESQPLLPFR